MTRKMKRWTSVALVLALLVCTGACGFAEHPTEITEPTTSPTTSPTSEPTTKPTTAPTTEPTAWNPGTSEKMEVGAEQIRMSGYQENWVTRFCNTIGETRSVGSVQELEAVLDQVRGLGKEFADPEVYDAAFFETGFLVLIPAQSTSGSVRFDAAASAENGEITVSLMGKLNGIGTADMADWLVLITLPRERFDINASITVETDGGKVQDPGLDIYDQ